MSYAIHIPSSGGKAGYGRNKTSAVQVRNFGRIVKQFRFVAGDVASKRRANLRAEDWVSKQREENMTNYTKNVVRKIRVAVSKRETFIMTYSELERTALSPTEDSSTTIDRLAKAAKCDWLTKDGEVRFFEGN